MTIHELARRGVSGRQIARTLEVTEGTVRYHRRRLAAGAEDGRAKQSFLATRWHDQIAEWLAAYEEADEPVNLVVLHEWLVKEAGYSGSLRSLQRYVGARFPQPRVRARRRVETPPGAQAQADWAVFGGVQIADAPCDVYAFRLKLSHSRRAATVWRSAEGSAGVAPGTQRGLPSAAGGAGGLAGRQREDGRLAGRRGLGHDQPSLPTLRRDGAVPHRCVRPTGARGKREG